MQPASARSSPIRREGRSFSGTTTRERRAALTASASRWSRSMPAFQVVRVVASHSSVWMLT